MHAMGSPVRLRILETIGQDELGSGEISRAAGYSPSATSQQLKVLREAGLVLVRVDARRRLYRVDFARLAEVRAFLDSFWKVALTDLKAVAEADPEANPSRGDGR